MKNLKYNLARLLNFLTFNKVYIRKAFPRESTELAKEFFKHKPINVMEIGTEAGLNAESIFNTLNVNRFYIVDPYLSYQDYISSENQRTQLNLSKHEKKAQKRLKYFENNIIWVKELSSKALNEIDERFDFIYIDGNHEYEYVLDDIKKSWKLLKEEGILAGHDIQYKGVSDAVIDFVKENNLKVYFGNKMDWIIIKSSKEL